MVDSSTRKVDAVVIGAGISGLTIAYHLKQKGLQVLVLEKSRRVGGSIHTIRTKGFCIDQGPNTALETSPEIRQFIDTIGLREEHLYGNPLARTRYVIRQSTLHPVPLHPLRFLTSSLFSFNAKLRLFREPWVKPAPEATEETISEFVTRRLGREFLDYAINPFIAGVYAGDPDQLSVRHAVAKIYALEKQYGSLIRGAIMKRKERKKGGEKNKTTARLFNFRSGMAALPQKIASHLDGSLFLDVEVTGLNFKGPGQYRIVYNHGGKEHRITAPILVLACPAYAAASLIADQDPNISGTLNQIYYAPVAQVFLGYKKEQCGHPLNGFGFLVPAKEEESILGLLFSSTLFPGRAPDGHIALTAFIGGSRQPELVPRPESELIVITKEAAAKFLDVTGEPVLTSVYAWKRAIPQYMLGYGKILDAFQACEDANPGLYFTGNYREGIAMSDCILNASALRDRILNNM